MIVGINAHIFDGQNGLGDLSIKYRPDDLVGANGFALERVQSNITTRVHQLPDVRLAVLLGDEANQVCPGKHGTDVNKW